MKIVIQGAGEVGSHLAKMLSAEAHEITVIDQDDNRLQKLSSRPDIVCLQGDPTAISTLRNAQVDKADLFISVNPNTKQDVNLVSSLIAKQIGCKKVCARIDEEEYLSSENRFMFTEMGVDVLFYPEQIAAFEIANQLKLKASTEAMDFTNEKLQMAYFRIEEESKLLDMRMAEFSAMLRDKLQFRVVAISRENKTIIPKHDTKFKFHDTVFIMTTQEGIHDLHNYFGKEEIDIENVMILGGSRIGEMLANKLSPIMKNIKILEKDIDTCARIREETRNNVVVALGDGRNSDVLFEEDIKNYDAFVAVTGNDEANVLSCIIAKKFGVSHTVAEVENLEYIRLAEDLGVDLIINKKLLTANMIFKTTLSNRIRLIKYMHNTNAEIIEYIAQPNSLVTRDLVKNTNFPQNAIIGGVIRRDEALIIDGESQIEAYDRVIIFALPDAISEIDRLFKR